MADVVETEVAHRWQNGARGSVAWNGTGAVQDKGRRTGFECISSSGSSTGVPRRGRGEGEGHQQEGWTGAKTRAERSVDRR